jgi:acyl-CoA thioesterase I
MSKIKIGATCLAILSLSATVLAGEDCRLVANLKAGKPQTIVAYGTSLTEAGAWVRQLQEALNARYPGLATVINSGRGGMWSGWGLENVETQVIAKKPDAVFIEFAINDASLDRQTSVPKARSNLTTMIDRILSARPHADIILMTMNPPVGIHREHRPKIDDYYQMYRDVAKERKLLLIDHAANWEPLLKTNKDLYAKYVPDGVHPTPGGSWNVTTPAILDALGIQAESPATTNAAPRAPAP